MSNPKDPVTGLPDLELRTGKSTVSISEDGQQALILVRDYNNMAGMYLDKDDATKLRNWLNDFIGDT
jgi:hypothetical protein